MEAQRVLLAPLVLLAPSFASEMTETSVTSGRATPQDGGHNSGVIIALGVAAVLAIATIIFCAIYWIRRRRRPMAEEEELREVLVDTPDVPEVDVTPEAAMDGGDEAPTEEAETTSHWPIHIDVTSIIRHMADLKPKPKKPAPMAMTLHEKTQEIKRKRRFRSLRSFFRYYRQKPLTRSQIRREQAEKTRQVCLWLDRRRGKKIKIEEKNPKKRRRSCLCCG
ncbi:uncharacterized protein [Dendropsophus ebraccatus]|uniref:uncharacterized protein n=1 Tax=Dendropsophus ebraccatus TaxID=150705 RepID=UPI0038311111